MEEPHASGSAAKPNHFPMLKERVNTLSNQVLQLISHFQEANKKSLEMAAPEDEVYGFLSPRQEREWKEV